MCIIAWQKNLLWLQLNINVKYTEVFLNLIANKKDFVCIYNGNFKNKKSIKK